MIMASKKVVKKSLGPRKRGFLLSFLLISSFFAIPYTFFKTELFSKEYYELSYVFVPSWYIHYLLIFNAISLVSSAAMWFWRKWGVYLGIAQSFIGLCLTIYMRSKYPIFAFVFQVISATVGIYIISRKWKYFE